MTEPLTLSIANNLWLAFVDAALRVLQLLLFATPIRLGELDISPTPIGHALEFPGHWMG